MMRYLIPVLFAIFIIGLSACEGGTTTQGSVYRGGTNALLVSFERDAPPDLIYDNSQTPFSILLNVKNDGEFDTANVRWRITGINTNDFVNLETRGTHNDTIMGRTMLQDQEIDGEQTYIELEGTRGEPICYQRSLRGGGELRDLSLKVDLCYGYATLATSTVCIREDYLDGGDGCDPRTSSQISVSGAPLTISGFSQQHVGRDRLRLQYDIELRNNVNIWAPGPGQDCTGSRTERLQQENQVYVKIDTNNLGSISCVNLRSGPSGADGEHVLNSRNYPQELLTGAALNIDNFADDASGYIRLGPDNKASLICTLTLEHRLTDSLGTMDIALAYFIEDSVTKPLTITHTSIDGPVVCGSVDTRPRDRGTDPRDECSGVPNTNCVNRCEGNVFVRTSNVRCVDNRWVCDTQQINCRDHGEVCDDSSHIVGCRAPQQPAPTSPPPNPGTCTCESYFDPSDSTTQWRVSQNRCDDYMGYTPQCQPGGNCLCTR